jgi:hypothetical protein
MSIHPGLFLALVWLPVATFCQEIPAGTYAREGEFFSFLPGNKVAFKVSGVDCTPYYYEGTGQYNIQEGLISILPDNTRGIPDTIVRKYAAEPISGRIRVHVSGTGGSISGAAVQVQDKDKRTVSAEATDAEGNALVRIPAEAEFIVVSYSDLTPATIRNLSQKHRYEVFLDHPTGFMGTRSYFRSFSGGLEYTFRNGAFSICRSTFVCSQGEYSMEWFTYKPQ